MDSSTSAILYTFRRCPYAIRSRLAIMHSAIKVEVREVILKDKPMSLLAYSPKATVPVLVTADKTVIDESKDIMLWALQQSDPDDWLCDGMELLQQQMFNLISENDNEFKTHLDRYKYADRYPEQTELQHRENALQFINQLELLLNTNHNLLRNEISLADMAIFPFVRQFSMVDPKWFDTAELPKVQAWLQRHLKSALFIAVMEKYPQWSAGDTPTFFSATMDV